jgi:hypothetical protein
MAHTWAIVTLTPDSTCCQTIHDLVLEQDTNQSEQDCAAMIERKHTRHDEPQVSSKMDEYDEAFQRKETAR